MGLRFWNEVWIEVWKTNKMLVLAPQNAIQALYHIGQHRAQSIVLHFSVDLLSCYKHCKHCRPYIEKVLSSRMQCHYQIDRAPYKCAVTNYIRCVNAFINIQEWWNLSVQHNLHFTAFHCISLHFTALAGHFSARHFTAGRYAVQCIVISTENREPARGENRVSFYAG